VSSSFAEKLELKVEQWYPAVVAIGVGGVAYFFIDLASIEGFRDLLQTAVNLSAITVGFLATSKSILLTIEKKKVVAALKSDKQWPMLIDYMMCAIYSAFLLALVSGGLLLVKFKEPADWHHAATSVWVFCLVLALLTGIRIVRFFAWILKLD
jgi:hypothetical protein